MKLTIVIEKDKNGYYAECKELDGCFTQGDNYDEIMDNIKDVVKLHLEDNATPKGRMHE